MRLSQKLLILGGAILGTSGLSVADDFKSLVQDRINGGVEAVPDTVPYSYLVDIELINAHKEEENFSGQYRVNPAAEPGERITIIGASWDDFPKGMRAELEKVNQERTQADFAEEFWCQGEPETFEFLASDDVTVLRETETEAVVSLAGDAVAHFLGDDGEGERKMPGKILKRMDSELTFSKPELRLLNSHIWLTRPTTVKIVAKMKEMDFNTRCSIAPNGLSHFSYSNTKVSGKAIGKSFGATIIVKMSDLQPNN